MSIKTRLLSCLAALAAGMAAMGLSGWGSTSIMNGRMQSIIADRVAPMQQLKAVADAYAVDIVDTAHKARDGAMSADEAAESITHAKTTIAENWDAYRATDLTAQEQMPAQSVAESVSRFNIGSEAVGERREFVRKAAAAAAARPRDLLPRCGFRVRAAPPVRFGPFMTKQDGRNSDLD